MRLTRLIILMGFCSSLFGQAFIGDISGEMIKNGVESEFIWRFEENQTIYLLTYELENESSKVEIVFDGDTMAKVMIYRGDKLSESKIYTPSQLPKEAIVIEQESSEGPVLLDLATTNYHIRTSDREIDTWIAEIPIDWHGAEYFFKEDVPFTLASVHGNQFPLKILSTDLKGELKYSFIVTTITEK